MNEYGEKLLENYAPPVAGPVDDALTGLASAGEFLRALVETLTDMAKDELIENRDQVISGFSSAYDYLAEAIDFPLPDVIEEAIEAKGKELITDWFTKLIDSYIAAE